MFGQSNTIYTFDGFLSLKCHVYLTDYHMIEVVYFLSGRKKKRNVSKAHNQSGKIAKCDGEMQKSVRNTVYPRKFITFYCARKLLRFARNSHLYQNCKLFNTTCNILQETFVILQSSLFSIFATDDGFVFVSDKVSLTSKH